MYYVYLLIEHSGSRRYIGYTSDLKRRVAEHRREKSGYTASGNWELVYYEAYRNKADAQLREKRLKADGRARRYLYDRAAQSMLEPTEHK